VIFQRNDQGATADRIRHIGRTASGHGVVSKWGAGLLWEHDTWEVPASYGSNVRFFASPTWQTSQAQFLAFITAQEDFARFREYALAQG
jgi:hypothetical protein